MADKKKSDTTDEGATSAQEIASQRLSKHETGDQSNEGGVQASTPNPAPAFDLAKLSPDQLYQLKDMIDTLPARPQAAAGRPVVSLRIMDDKLVIDFKNAFNTWVKDEQANQNVEMVMIPVRFLGSDGFTNVRWKDFMEAHQVPCEVIKRDSVPGEVPDGSPYVSRWNGKTVVPTVKRLIETFTVRLPKGFEPSQLTLEARIVNA